MEQAEATVLAEVGEAERLALGHAPARLAPAYRSVFALDGVLRRIALSARDPLPAQLRLAWWREAVAQLPGRRDHPVLAALAECAPRAESLVALVDLWEVIAVREGSFAGAAHELGGGRGAALAGLAGEPGEAAREAARCWTLAELAAHAPTPVEREAMLAEAGAMRWPPLPRSLRPLAVLAGLARRSARRGGGPLLGDRLSPLAALRLGILGR